MRNLNDSLLFLTRGDESQSFQVGLHGVGAVAEEAAQAARTAADGSARSSTSARSAVEATFDWDRVFQVRGGVPGGRALPPLQADSR